MVDKTKKVEKGITAISVCGFKSHNNKSRIEIRPLTILAGANSSGKSSIMQPLLLLKQTMEASYDPGALLLDGPNVRFTSIDQFLSKFKSKCSGSFQVEIELEKDQTLDLHFKKQKKELDIKQMKFIDTRDQDISITLRPEMPHNEIKRSLPKGMDEFYKNRFKEKKGKKEWSVKRNKCLLYLTFQSVRDKNKVPSFPLLSPSQFFEPFIRNMIHIPGLRGNPRRTYGKTAVESDFPGTFEKYVASIIAQWQSTDSNKQKKLGNALKALGLTWKVTAKPIDDAQVELKVGRLPNSVKGGAHDLVSIADVGFGVSQVLPVIVALLVSEPNQLVYIEQPELHLHPRAQVALAKIIADTAKRGVRVVIETHSSLLLLAVQTIVSKKGIKPDLVKLHWFSRKPDGSTKIDSADLDKSGAFGDWPEDFGDVELKAESNYLDAAEADL